MKKQSSPTKKASPARASPKKNSPVSPVAKKPKCIHFPLKGKVKFAQTIRKSKSDDKVLCACRDDVMAYVLCSGDLSERNLDAQKYVAGLIKTKEEAQIFGDVSMVVGSVKPVDMRYYERFVKSQSATAGKAIEKKKKSPRKVPSPKKTKLAEKPADDTERDVKLQA